MNNIEEMICRVCKKKFLRRTKARSQRNNPKVRRVNAVTCSEKCSKENLRMWKSGSRNLRKLSVRMKRYYLAHREEILAREKERRKRLKDGKL